MHIVACLASARNGGNKNLPDCRSHLLSNTEDLIVAHMQGRDILYAINCHPQLRLQRLTNVLGHILVQLKLQHMLHKFWSKCCCSLSGGQASIDRSGTRAVGQSKKKMRECSFGTR